MGNDGRFSWIKDGLDQKDRIQKDSLKERAGKENTATKKERARVQDDEQKKINLYSEGVCYKCHKVDQVLSSLFLVCKECVEKHGDEALLNIVTFPKMIWELCDFHEEWVWYEVMQINCSLCNSCLRRIKKLHQAYRRSGGRIKNSPDYVRRRKIYGKDYNHLLGSSLKEFKMRTSNSSYLY